MICAIRPGAKFFDETVNTLKYADRAKQIKNKAVVNENPADKLIRELKEENERLKAALAKGGGGDGKTKEEIQADLKQNALALGEMEGNFEDRLKAELEKREAEEEKLEKEEKAKKDGAPHLVNLNEDPQLDRMVQYMITPNCPLVCGRRAKGCTHGLQLSGVGI